MESGEPSANEDATVVTGGRDLPAASEKLRQGSSVGRYVILEEVGRGGMGRVYRAYDPKLRREVALKLVLTKSAEAEARTTREAQAMAALSHPNVVPVYDVDLFEGRLYIAMEFIAGHTLRRWIRDHDDDISRSRAAEAVGIMAQVGRGLAAAHDAGLIHRDLKPSNVLIGADGRVRVMDFGLATEQSTSRSDSGGTSGSLSGDDVGFDSNDGSGDAPSSTETPLTEAGTILGTPKYMAPEQHRAEELDARTDQYSFCVCLFEAVFGVRPFRASRLEKLARAKLRGLKGLPASPATSKTLKAAIRRGLSPKPADRFRSMSALVEAIEPRRAGRSRLGLGLLATGFGTAAAATALWVGAGRTDPCDGVDAPMIIAWSPERSEALATSIANTDVAFAVDTSERIVERLGTYAARWGDARREACSAARVRGEDSEALNDRRIGCLESALQTFELTVDALSTDVDATTVRNGLRAALSLPPIAHCEDVDALLASVPPPGDPATASEVERVRRELEQARAMRAAGRYEAALQHVEAQSRAAEVAGYAPLDAELHDLLGQLLIKTGQHERAQSTLARAYATAVSSSHDEVAARSLAKLTFVTGNLLQDHELALSRARDSEAWAKRIGTDEALAVHYNAHAGVLQQVARYAEARRLFERALKLREALHDPGAPEIANALNNLGNVHMDEGNPNLAKPLYARAVELSEKTFGPQHPRVGGFANNLSNAHRSTGDLEAAERELRRAIEIYEGVHGREHPDVAGFIGNLGGLVLARGDLDRARSIYEEALALERKVLVAGHPRLAVTLVNLGGIELRAEQPHRALTYFEQALAIAEEAYGDAHPGLAAPLEGAAAARSALGEPAKAIASLRRAVEIRDASEGDADDEARTLFSLATLLIETPQGRPEALSLGARAESMLDDDSDPAFRTEVEQWRATHRDAAAGERTDG